MVTRLLTTPHSESGAVASDGGPGSSRSFSPFPSIPRTLFIDQTGQLGGAELALLDTAAAFRARASVVLFADGPLREALADAGVEVRVLPAGSAMLDVRRGAGWTAQARAAAGSLRQARALAKLARDQGAELLYANTPKALVAAALASCFPGMKSAVPSSPPASQSEPAGSAPGSPARPRLPLVYHLHDILTADHFSPLNRRLIVALCNRFVARVIANSRATADAFALAGGDPGRITVIANGIDPAPFDAAARVPTAELRRRFGLPPGVPLVGLFGRISPWKGHHILLEALGAPGPGPGRAPGVGGGPPGRAAAPVHAAMVGDALFGEQAYARELRQQAAALGLGDRVHWLGFRGFRREVPELMRAADVVVHCSTAPEPFGRVVVEAMLAGRPVVAADAGGPAEILRGGVTGLLTPPGDAAALAHALERLFADAALGPRLCAAAGPEARRRYAPRAIHAALAAALTAATWNHLKADFAAGKRR